MAFTATDLVNIDAAIVTIATKGVAELEINGRRIKYQSIEELLKLRDFIQTELNSDTYGGSIPVSFTEASG